MEDRKGKVETAGVAGGAVRHLCLNEAGRGERGKGKGNNRLNRANHSKQVVHSLCIFGKQCKFTKVYVKT